MVATIADGFLWSSGNAMDRALDYIMGPRHIEIEVVPSSAAQVAYFAAPADAGVRQNRAFNDDITRKDNELKKKYQELQIEQEKIANKESDRIKRALAEHEAALKERNSQFEAELETKMKLTEEKIENKRRASDLREVELHQREDLIMEKEHDLEVQARAIGDKEKDLSEKLIIVEEKSVLAAEKEESLNSIHRL